jgi:flagellar biosynthesis protein FlhF
MELKRIIARDSRSANEKAIQLYGPDVLIISSQRVDHQTELIVAVDVASAPADAAQAEQGAPSAAQAAGAAGAHAFKSDDDQFLPFAAVFQNASAQAAPARLHDDAHEGAFQAGQAQGMSRGMAMAPEAASMSAAAPRMAPVVTPMTAPASAPLSAPLTAPMAPTQPLAAHAPAPQAPSAAHYEQQRSHEIVDLLRQEMAALRQEFALSRQMQPWQQALGLSADIQKLSMAMQEVGMPVALRSLLTDSIQQLDTLEEAWPVVARLLADAISRPAMSVPDTGVHALCGPSGAGKTSMLGRLAYAAAQTHGAEKQVMISYGDQRPGAWSQIQLLASQAGATCFRVADMAMLQTLLDDLHGKTIWIDTPGADFAAQAQQLQSQMGLAIHAVLPVDATVTSVQKILQNPEIRWSSMMLTKVDEAAYPWPLIKGLCDQSLAVSCMAEDSKINVPPLSFGAQRLVALAMTPLQALLPELQHLPAVAEPAKAVRKPRAKKEAAVSLDIQPKPRAVKPRAVTAKSSAKAVHG